MSPLQATQQLILKQISSVRIPKQVYAIFIFIYFGQSVIAQPVTSSTVNVTGGSATSGNYRFEWSVGEASAITTMGNSNLIVTNGFLQYEVQNQPLLNDILPWQPGEVKVYPNPVKDILEVNILHNLTGKIHIKLYFLDGRKIMDKEFDYNGMGAIERFNLGALAAGQYLLNIQQISPLTGRPVKKGAFKILKIN
jgi:hypothetical protein